MPKSMRATNQQVGPAHDAYEQEADHMAQQVMRLPKGKEEDELPQ